MHIGKKIKYLMFFYNLVLLLLYLMQLLLYLIGLNINNINTKNTMKNITKKYFQLFTLIGTLTFLTMNHSSAQITVDNTYTVGDLIQNVLAGSGVQISNITVNGGAATQNTVLGNATYFTDGGTNFPISSGVLLTTGNGVGAVGPNTSTSFSNNAPPTAIVTSDPHLQIISGNNCSGLIPICPENGIVIEFDFIPAGDSIKFQYLFGSDEYPEYSPSQYNDAFGFFLWGPGISGPYNLAGYPNGGANIATIPGTTTPVTINNVGPTANSQYYVNNNVQNNPAMAYYGNAIQYDGTTVPLWALAEVQCGETYHIKLAIANVGDEGYDSGVFLQANSFSSSTVDISIVTANASVSDTVLIAGCTEGSVVFSRPPSQADSSLTIHFETGGDLVEGTHYDYLAGQGIDSIVFSPGQDTISLSIIPYPIDTAGTYELIISASTVNACGDTIVTSGSIWVLNEPNSVVTATDSTLFCYTDSIPLNASIASDFNLEPYTYTWSLLNTPNDTLHQGLPFITEQMQNDTVHYLVQVTDRCGFTYVDTATVIMNQTLSIDSLVQYPATCGLNDGVVLAFPSGITGTPEYIWTTSIVDTIPGDSVSATAWPDRPATWHYFSVTDDVCYQLDSILVEQLPPPEASFTATPQEGFSPLTVSFNNTSDPADSYYWEFGNGTDTIIYSLDDPNNQVYIAEGEYTITLMLTEGGCTDFATQTVIVEEYLPITYTMPNIFTPNGDGSNDFFHIQLQNAKSIKIEILNRWGNLVFDSYDVNFIWNGKVQNSGPECTDGTYFYRFTVTDLYGETVEEHGFVHLVR